MPVEGIQQLHLQKKTRGLSNRSFFDYAEVLLEKEIIANFTRYAWDISELEITVVACWASPSLFCTKNTIRPLVLTVERWRGLERAVTWILAAKQAVELAVYVRIRSSYMALCSQVAERIDL